MNGLHRYYSCLIDLGKLSATLSKQNSLLKLLSSHSICSSRQSHAGVFSQQSICAPLIKNSFVLCNQQHNILISHQPGIGLSIPVRYQTASSTDNEKKNITSTRKDDDEIADLQAVLKDKSLGITTKFKILFKQYGVVITAVYATTTAFWITLIYSLLSNGVDIIPILDKLGVFDILKSIGFHHAEKLKTSGASYWITTYVVYEIIKPIRIMVTLFGTAASVRWLRRAGYMKSPPKSATVGDLMKTKGQLFHRQVSEEYRRHYQTRVRRKYRAFVSGKRLLMKKGETGGNGNAKKGMKTDGKNDPES